MLDRPRTRDRVAGRQAEGGPLAVSNRVAAAAFGNRGGARCDGRALCWEYNRRAPATARTTVTSFGRAMRREGYVLKKQGRDRVRSIGRTSRRSGQPS